MQPCLSRLKWTSGTTTPLQDSGSVLSVSFGPQSVGIGDNCAQDLGLVGTIGSQLPLLAGLPLVDPALICQGPVTQVGGLYHRVQGPSSDSCNAPSPQWPICLGSLHCWAAAPGSHISPKQASQRGLRFGFMGGLWTRRPPMLRDVRVFPVPWFLLGRSWGGDKEQDVVTCSCVVFLSF